MTRLRGRCPNGQRLRCKAPFGHWMTQTFVASLRCDKLTAPFVVNAPMNRCIFETYVEKELAPTLDKAMSSSWTIWRPTRARPPRKPSRPGVHGSCSCHPIALTSIRSKWPSQSLKPTSAQKPSGPSMPPLAGDRAHLRSLRARGMPKLLHRRRIWIQLSVRRSRPGLAPDDSQILALCERRAVRIESRVFL